MTEHAGTDVLNLPPGPPDPLHETAGPASAWTRVNAAEAMPGVPTPLTWTWYFRICERAMREAFFDLGVLRRAELEIPEQLDDRFMGIFFGRMTGSVDMMRRLGDSTPGNSGEGIERQIFGSVRPGVPDTPRRDRYPAVIMKFPVAAITSQRRVRRLTAEIDAWWQRTLPLIDVMSRAEAQDAFRDATERYQAVVRPHIVVSMVVQTLFERAHKLCDAAGQPGLVHEIMVSADPTPETETVAALWELSRERLTLERFLQAHGYHGPAESELSCRVWREDPAPVVARAEAFARMDEDDSPSSVHDRSVERRREAIASLMAGLPRSKRLEARAVLDLIRRTVPVRELGRAAFLRCTDVARAATHRLARELHADGVIADTDDAFFLTESELLTSTGPGGESIRLRQDRRAFYESLELPDSWVGNPTPTITSDAPTEPSGQVRGVGASPGVAEGRARIVQDSSASDAFAAGDVLVCHTTDPSWAPLFLLASAVVIDIGGPMSHGAIVARELGIPCVIHTVDGTRRLRDGSVLRVDGGAGVVDVQPDVGA